MGASSLSPERAAQKLNQIPGYCMSLHSVSRIMKERRCQMREGALRAAVKKRQPRGSAPDPGIFGGMAPVFDL